MSTRRSTLALLAGVALFPVAIQKIRDFVQPYNSTAPLLQIHPTPLSVGAFTFLASDGQPLIFRNFVGQHLLVNIWATWCPPCRKEMPSLDRLKAIIGSKNEPEILAISVDQVSFEQLRGFYAANSVTHLALYSANQAEIFDALLITGLPTTLLIDDTGMEIGRLIGPTTWDAPEVAKQLSALTAL